jgi:hypothetical protein
MPKGPCGEKRPGDVIGAAIMVAKIATGEVQDSKEGLPRSSASKNGGIVRARKLTAVERSRIAKDAAKRRWEKATAGRENEE